MPAVSAKQKRFMCAEYGRAKKGKLTKTKMTKEQLRDYCVGDLQKKGKR